MNSKLFINLLLILYSSYTYSQPAVIGKTPKLADKEIKLVGFKGFQTYTIDSITANKNGTFQLSFCPDDYGMGYLITRDMKPISVVLCNEGLELKGETLFTPDAVEISKGNKNKLFKQYTTESSRREQALSAWRYLEKIYISDSLFTVHEIPIKVIAKEMQRIKAEDSLFLVSLPRDSYLSYFLPLHKLISTVSIIAQYRPEEIPFALESFRNIDYTDPRLQKSGVFADVIESHFWLIENSGRSLDSVYLEMNNSIDLLIDNLLVDERKLNEVTEYLFKYLEKRSLFKASEYLALKLLNEQGCTINSDLAAQLESYRAMKKGNIAPNILFAEDFNAPTFAIGTKPKNLYDIQSNYKLVVFGASWCPQCPSELQEIAKYYTTCKEHSVEVVFISLDEDKQTFTNFTRPFPFISSCDYKKWESKAVKDYHVFATPTIYLLNSKNEILLKPNSVSQLNSWIDWYLVKGNKLN